MTADTSWLESMPEVYDRCLGLAVFAPFARRARAPCRRRPNPSRVLEIAAGTGIVTAGLVEALPDAEITATDLNPPMVDYASTRVPGPTWRVADAQDLDLDDDVFDLVVCQFGVMFFPNRIGAYREVRRVLEPHGSFLFNVWDTLDTSELPAAVYAALAEVLPDDPPDFVRAGPARVRRPDADQGRRPGRRPHGRGAGADRAGREVTLGRAAGRGLLPRHAAAVPAAGARRPRRHRAEGRGG